MRTSVAAGSVVGIAITIVSLNIESLRAPRPHLELSYAAAGEHETVVATSTLTRAPESAWGDPESEAPPEQKPVRKTISGRPGVPARLEIPSIALNRAIEPVGINASGEMDVPPGSSANVGWYKGGPRPGEVGSSVVDAHVFAAFEELRYVKIGDDIIVEDANGQKLRFVVEDARVYKLGELTPQLLFGRKDARRLNLITCAGQPIGDTYSHRLVVYAVFEAVL